MSRITALCRPGSLWSRQTRNAATIAISMSILLLLQPACSFPLERTGGSLRIQHARFQHQSVVSSHHAHDPDFSSEKDRVDPRPHQQQQQQQQQQQRRQFLQALSLSTLALPFWGLATALPARAADETETTDQTRTFVRRTNQYAYQFTPPPNFTPGNKPVKTHLDENNFQSSDVSGWQFGITVDPVRLQSLAEFGTPGQVAAKVVTAEVNRDGVFDVKLMQDPIEQRGSSSGDTGTSNGLVLDYLSSGKRGDKRFVAKLFVENQKLYVLTAQCKQADYEAVKKELLEAVDSFRVLQN